MASTEYYDDKVHGPHKYFEIRDFVLEMGETLRDARLAYKTHGELNKEKSNAILFPHMYSGTSSAMEMFIGKPGEGRPLDPGEYFIILPGQFGNGFSSSPSNQPMPFDRSAFPRVTIADDVRAQHRLVTEQFGIRELQLVLGWSMGAQQTYEWAVRYPDMVKRAAPFAGFAKATPHNALFVRVHEDAIRSDPAWEDGFYTELHAVHLGLRRHARVFALMGASPELYKRELWRRLGFASLEDVVLRRPRPQQEGAGFASLDDFLRCFWEGWFVRMDPNNLLCMAWKWRHGDVSGYANGSLEAALGRITARTTVVAFSTDMFFPVADCAAEQALIRNSKLEVIDSPWGHFAMFCLRNEDQRAIDGVLARLLTEPPSV